ncbi:MAG: IS3 family transposase, partial [Oscillospiraceae bacterium]|nr:IS3 family transposase [Oscillospiraceae bacterium]
ESFFASIKKEDFRRNFYKTEEEFREAVAKYIEFYNDYRPHQRLGSLTPNQAEAEYYSSFLETETIAPTNFQNDDE